MFEGIKIIESPHVPPGQAVLIGSDMVVFAQPQKETPMSNTEKVATKARNLLTSAVTIITVLSVVLAEVAEQVAGLQGPVAQIITSIGAIVLIVRRVTPVPAEERGLS